MRGLIQYLAGPGRANEHTEPHLVGGDGALMAWHSGTVIDRAAADAIADYLDLPRQVFRVEITTPVKNGEGEEVERRAAHVWHCSLSVRADEGALSEDQWAGIAQDFVDEMGFTDASGKAHCRWAAVHHGTSKAGNDHIHVVVNLVREDGTKASVHNDRPRAQQVARELEARYGLRVLHSPAAGVSERGHTPGELRRGTVIDGQPETEVTRLERRVRAAATRAGSEAEFVRILRRSGVAVRPRFAPDRDDVIQGWSAAERDSHGRAIRWYGGGRLARDLTIQRLRSGWTDSPALAADAAAEWRAAWRGLPVVGDDEAPPVPADWAAHARELESLREQLRQVAATDIATWARAARGTAGVLSAWAETDPEHAEELSRAANEVARTAQIRAWQERGATPLPSVRGAARIVAMAAKGGQGRMAQAVILRQLLNTMRALHDAHIAAGRLDEARRHESAVRDRLARVAARLPDVPQTPTQTRMPGPPGTSVRPSPVPGRLTPGRDRVTSDRDRGAGI